MIRHRKRVEKDRIKVGKKEKRTGELEGEWKEELRLDCRKEKIALKDWKNAENWNIGRRKEREEGTERLEEWGKEKKELKDWKNAEKRRRNRKIGRMQEEKKELKYWKNAGREEGTERLEECRKRIRKLK